MPLAPPIDAIQQPSVGIYGLPVGASAGAMVLLTAAQIRAHADLSGYVPYTGATGAVNLGANALTVGAITASGVVRVALDSIAAFRVGTIDGITNGLGSRYGTACNIYAVGVNHTCFSNTGILTRSDRAIGWSNVTDPYTDSDLLLRRGGAGILEQRNGTNAQIFTIEKTYTSSTSREYIQSGWNATDSAYDVGVSYQGSAGGSLQAVRIGNRTAAGVFSGLTVATSGAVTASGTISTTSTYVDIGPAAGLRLRHDGANSYLTTSIGTMTVGTTASTSLILQTSSNTRLTLDNVGNFTFLGGKVVFAYTGGITSSGTIITRNGTSPTSIQITNTYTSSTSFGLLDIRANAAQTAYEISSFLGSAGGANLPINIGHRDSAGTFTSALSVATNGRLSFQYWVNPGGGGEIFGWEAGLGSGTLQGYGAHINTTGKIGASQLLLTGGSSVSASTPGLFASGTTLKVRRTNDSADADLTCGAITASGTIITRNGTSPTSIQITNTYTSATSFGLLDIRANAAQTAYEISSFLGSAGGAALPINIGHRSSGGTFTSALSVATSGTITVASGFVSSNWTRIAGSDLPERGIAVRDSQLSLASNVGIYWSTALDPTNNQNGGTIKMLSGVLTISGQITHVPPTSSVTLGTNGQFSIEMTSDTAGNLVYRGSDGTTRRAALVFV